MDKVGRQAFATACGVLAAIYAVLLLGLEEPFWAALSALVIANVDHEALFTKAVLRSASTVAGVLVGYNVGQWTEGLVLMQAVLVATAAGIGIYGRQRTAFGYAWFYGSITFVLMMLYAMVQPQQLYGLAHYRCYEIVVGVVCGTLASWALAAPVDGLRPHLAAQAIKTTAVAAFRQATVAALGAMVIVLIWTEFNLPDLPQVLVSSLVVMDGDLNTTRHRGAQRILGCIIGGVAALVVIAVDASNVVWWAAMVFLGVFLFARVHLEKSARAYVGTQSAVAYIITLVGSGPPETLAPPINRLVGIMIGVGLMTALVWGFGAARSKASSPGNDGAGQAAGAQPS